MDEQTELLVSQNEQLREENETLLKNIFELQEKNNEYKHRNASLQGKNTHLTLKISRKEDEIYQEILQERANEIGDDVVAKIKKELEEKYVKKTVDNLNSIIRDVEIRKFKGNNFKKIAIRRVNDAYTDYLENSDTATERATGYLIALRKFQKELKEAERETTTTPLELGDYVTFKANYDDYREMWWVTNDSNYSNYLEF